MFFEYALEPTLVSSWDRARFFLDAFGPSKGRFLARYPRHWKRLVYECLRCPDVEKKRIGVRLEQLDKRVLSPRAGAIYDGARPWLENAVIENGRRPFHAILANGVAAKPNVVDGAAVDDSDPLWKVENGRFVSRDPAAFVAALELLLAASTRVLIIDPYFRADRDEKTRPVAAFCLAVGGSATVEVHFSEAHCSREEGMRIAERALPRALPSGAKITLHCWRVRPGGKRLHNRYVVTDVGGVKFGDGIEMGTSGQDDHLSILDETSRAAVWAQFTGAVTEYDRVGEAKEFAGT
jgi:hypothetical protein